MKNKEPMSYSEVVESGESRVGVIYLHDDISRYWWGFSPESFRHYIREFGDEVDSYVLRIMCNGGSTIGANAIASEIKRLNKPIRAEVEVAFSAATIPALACDEVTIAANGWWMMHHSMVEEAYMSNAKELRDMADMLEKIDSQLAELYVEKSNLSESEVLELMVNETLLSGSEAVEKGFASRTLADADYLATLSKPTETTAEKRSQFVDSAAAVIRDRRSSATLEPKDGGDPLSSVAATVDQIEAIAKDAPADWKFDQLKAQHTVEQVTAAWDQKRTQTISELQAKIDETQTQLDAANAKLKENEAAASGGSGGRRPLGQGKGNDGKASGDSGDAVATWKSELKALKDRGMSNHAAARKLVNEQPELHEEYLAAVQKK